MNDLEAVNPSSADVAFDKKKVCQVGENFQVPPSYELHFQMLSSNRVQTRRDLLGDLREGLEANETAKDEAGNLTLILDHYRSIEQPGTRTQNLPLASTMLRST